MHNPTRAAAALATTFALSAALVAAEPAAAPADPEESVVLVTAQAPDGTGAGTGMVLTPDGEVLKNHHVVRGSTQVQAEVPATGATYTATVVGHDASRDVALLRLQDAAGPAPSPPTA